MKIALLPGGFKPPHLGHYNMAKYLADFADKVVVRIGQKERDGIGKELALKIWNYYKAADPDGRAQKLIISIANSPSPVKDVYDFVELTAPEGSTVILGLGEKDATDGRYNNIPKFAEPRNIKAEIELVPPQAGGISGTRMREIIKSNNKEEFLQYIPGFLPEEIKEEIWTDLVDTTMPADIEEMMGGTMNKQEMDKHNANMKKLKQRLSKINSKGDMVPVPTDLTKGLRRKLYEGRYDAEVTNQSRFLIEEFKENFGEKYEAQTIGVFPGIEDDKKARYIIDYEFDPTKLQKVEPLPFVVDGEADAKTMEIKVFYDPNKFPQAYNDLIAEIKDTIRHELEHISQFRLSKGVNPKSTKQSQYTWFQYFTFDYEVPAFVQGLYKNSKTKKITLTKAIYQFLSNYLDVITDEEEQIIIKTWTDWARKNLPAVQLEEGDPKVGTGKKPKGSGRRLYTDENPKDTVSIKFSTRQDIVDTLSKKSFKSKSHARQSQIINLIHQRVRAAYGRAKDPAVKKRLKSGLDYITKRKEASKRKTQRMRKEGLFSQEWWLDVITEGILNEGGAAGHMAHPFDLPNVNNGKDLIKVFEQAADSLKKTPGSVKIDGVNASIRLIRDGDKRQFALDRGSKKALDLKGITKNDLEDRFGPGHGMVRAGGDVLDIFNDALPSIEEELEALGLWNDSNVMFNMEYVSGKSNVQDYGKNFLAIHGLLSIETKEVQGARKMLTKRVTSEKNYDKADLEELLRKLEPFAKKKGFEIYGSVPTVFTKEPDFKSVLNKQYKIEFSGKAETKSLGQWLSQVNNIPVNNRLKMNLETGGTKDVGALSKQVYFAVFGGETVDDLFDNDQEIQLAIKGATTYLATEKLGDAILDVLDSPMGSVNDHEGVVIRDSKISPRPFKITGKFITGGVSSQFQAK